MAKAKTAKQSIVSRRQWEQLHGAREGVSEPFKTLGWLWQPVMCRHTPAHILDVDTVKRQR